MRTIEVEFKRRFWYAAFIESNMPVVFAVVIKAFQFPKAVSDGEEGYIPYELFYLFIRNVNSPFCNNSRVGESSSSCNTFKIIVIQ